MCDILLFVLFGRIISNIYIIVDKYLYLFIFIHIYVNINSNRNELVYT